MKTCRKCGELKAESNFSAHGECADGLRPDCKACIATYNAEYRKKNREKLLAANKALWEKNKDRYNERVRAKRAENPAPFRARDKISKAKNRHKHVEKRRVLRIAWNAKNHERVLELARKHGAKRRLQIAVSGSYSQEWIARLYGLQKGLCIYCRSDLGDRFERDHIIPLSIGGTGDKDNIQLLCRPCNRAKRAKHPVDFAQTKGLLL